MKNYEFSNFKIEVIDETNSLNECNELEKYYINHFNSLSPNGYNISKGGDVHDLTNDMINKIRIKNQKITEDQAEEIRQKYNIKNITQKQLSQEYNLSYKSINNIIRNVTYINNDYNKIDNQIKCTFELAQKIREEYKDVYNTQKYLMLKYSLSIHHLNNILQNRIFIDSNYFPMKINNRRTVIFKNELSQFKIDKMLDEYYTTDISKNDFCKKYNIKNIGILIKTKHKYLGVPIKFKTFSKENRIKILNQLGINHPKFL